MAFNLSALRVSIQEQDFPKFERAVKRSPSAHVLQEAFVDLLAPEHVFFRKKAIPLLLGNGLDPNAVPAVAVESGYLGRFGHRDQDTMRLPYETFYAYDSVRMPLAARAAMVGAPELQSLLQAGANPRKMVSMGEQGVPFGSAWASALALTGRKESAEVLQALQEHDPGPWEEDLIKDVLRAIVRPGTHKAPPAGKWGMDGARQAWAVVQERVSEWSRSQWEAVWTDSIPWRRLISRTQEAHRLAFLAQVIPPNSLAGLFDACRKFNWDLRELALTAGLGGDMGCWETLQRHADLLGMKDLPVWSERKFTWKDAADVLHKETVALDGLGCLLLQASWSQGSSLTAQERNAVADAWVERLRDGANLAPNGRTLAQWRMMGTTGAPIAWMARHREWWDPHPETGRTPWHECAALEQLYHLPPDLTPDWLAVDQDGQEAGAAALALAAENEKLLGLAIKALKEGKLWANGTCMGRHAGTWVAFHPEMKKAYRESCKARGIVPPRGVQSRWRLHAAAQAMSPTRVRAILTRMDEATRHQALLEIDELGRTPLLWWAMARPETLRDGTISMKWQGRGDRVFELLAPPGAPLWRPGMCTHPFLELASLYETLLTVPDWPDDFIKRTAIDFGHHLKDPALRDEFLHRLSKPMLTGTVRGIEDVWRTWEPGPDQRREFLVGLWESWSRISEVSLGKDRLAKATLDLMESWKKLGMPMEPSDLSHPSVPLALERLKQRFPEQADILFRSPLIEVALHNLTMEQAIPEAPRSVPSPAGSKMRF